MLVLSLLFHLKFCHNLQEIFNETERVNSVWGLMKFLINQITESIFNSMVQFSVAVSDYEHFGTSLELSHDAVLLYEFLTG